MDAVTLALAKAYTNANRVAYTEPSKVLRTATLSVEDGMGVAEFESPIPLEEGKTYTVTTDSGSYTVVCKRYYSDGTAYPWVWVGDNPDIGEEPTYGFYYGETDGGLSNFALDFNGGTTFSISTTETIHPIDPKYLHTAIDLDEYGFDLANFVMAGGGSKQVDGTAEMWKTINKSKNVVFTSTMLGSTFTLVPCVYNTLPGYGKVVGIGLSLVSSAYGQIVYANIVIGAFTDSDGEYRDVSSVDATMTMTPLA